MVWPNKMVESDFLISSSFLVITKLNDNRLDLYTIRLSKIDAVE